MPSQVRFEDVLSDMEVKARRVAEILSEAISKYEIRWETIKNDALRDGYSFEDFVKQLVSARKVIYEILDAWKKSSHQEWKLTDEYIEKLETSLNKIQSNKGVIPWTNHPAYWHPLVSPRTSISIAEMAKRVFENNAILEFLDTLRDRRVKRLEEYFRKYWNSWYQAFLATREIHNFSIGGLTGLALILRPDMFLRIRGQNVPQIIRRVCGIEGRVPAWNHVKIAKYLLCLSKALEHIATLPNAPGELKQLINDDYRMLKLSYYLYHLHKVDEEQTLSEHRARSILRRQAAESEVNSVVHSVEEDICRKINESLKDELTSLLERKSQVILYGPPGTGKTWIARNYAECITREKGGKQWFVTFHQSYSYEEFVEGIWPEPSSQEYCYEQVRCFKEQTNPPSLDMDGSHIGRILWGPVAPNSSHNAICYLKPGDLVLHYVGRQSPIGTAFIGYSIVGECKQWLSRDEMARILERMGLFGNSAYKRFAERWLRRFGTFCVAWIEKHVRFEEPIKLSKLRRKDEKLYLLAKPRSNAYIEFIDCDAAKRILALAGEAPPEEHSPLKATGLQGIHYKVRDGIFKKAAVEATYALMKRLCHEQDFAQAAPDICEDISRPSINGGLTYEDMKQVFRKVLEKASYMQTGFRYKIVEALRRLRNAGEMPIYILVVDEINRGDISRILGELITLLEPDKRLAGEHQIVTILPYSEEPFAVPPNLYIIGTMNSADRSIALLDVALRRRFAFLEVVPETGVLSGRSVDGLDLGELLEALNKRIEEVLDRDHRIGHSYFLDVDSAADLRHVWVHEVMPLLAEYFYNQWDKLWLVLGDAAGYFIEREGGRYRLKDPGEWFSEIGVVEVLKKIVGGGSEAG